MCGSRWVATILFEWITLLASRPRSTKENTQGHRTEAAQTVRRQPVARSSRARNLNWTLRRVRYGHHLRPLNLTGDTVALDYILGVRGGFIINGQTTLNAESVFELPARRQLDWHRQPHRARRTKSHCRRSTRWSQAQVTQNWRSLVFRTFFVGSLSLGGGVFWRHRQPRIIKVRLLRLGGGCCFAWVTLSTQLQANAVGQTTEPTSGWK